MSNTTSRHRAPRPLHVRLLAGFLGFTLFLGLGAAVANVVGRAKVSGSGKSVTFLASWSTASGSAPTIDAANTSAYGGGVRVSATGDALLISTDTTGSQSAPEFLAGDTYTVSGSVNVKGRNAYISGVTFPGLPAGYRAEILSGCGASVTASTSSTAPGTPVKVKITREATDTSTADVTWNLGAGASVEVTPLKPGAAAPAGTVCAPYVGTGS